MPFYLYELEELHDLFIMSALPDNLQNFKKSLLLINEKLIYIKSDGKFDWVPINNYHTFISTLEEIKISNLNATTPNEIKIDDVKTKIQLTSEEFHELITLNGGYSLLSNDTILKSEKKNLISPSNVPLFFIPGIFGRGEFEHVIKNLRKENEIRDFFVFFHSSHIEGLLDEKASSLSEYADAIAQNLKEHLPPLSPVILFGYSFGGTLAALVAEKLALEKIPVFPYIMDGLTPELAMKHFSDDPTSLDVDFIRIIRSAAVHAAKSPIYREELKKISFDKETLPQPCMHLPPQAYLEKIKIHLLDNHIKKGELNFAVFEKDLNNATTAIQLMAEYETLEETTQLDQIFLFTTKQTVEKYPAIQKEWKNRAIKLRLVENSCLQNLDHLDLLSPTASPLVAASIQHFMSHVITPEQMLKHHIYSAFENYKNYYGLRLSFIKEESIDLTSSINELTLTSTPSIESFAISHNACKKSNTSSHTRKAITTFQDIAQTTNRHIKSLKINHQDLTCSRELLFSPIYDEEKQPNPNEKMLLKNKLKSN
jgi:hypothetical protein